MEKLAAQWRAEESPSPFYAYEVFPYTGDDGSPPPTLDVPGFSEVRR